MTKNEFFSQLENKLRGLPEQERLNIIGVYEDLFERARQNGKSEEDVVRSLGYSQLYGQPPENTGPYAPPFASEPGLKPIVASLALGLFNLIFVLGPAVGLIGALLGLTVAAIALTTGPLWIAIGTEWLSPMRNVQAFAGFAALASFGVGVLMLLGLSTVWKVLARVLKAYIRLNMRLIRGD